MKRPDALAGANGAVEHGDTNNVVSIIFAPHRQAMLGANAATEQGCPDWWGPLETPDLTPEAIAAGYVPSPEEIAEAEDWYFNLLARFDDLMAAVNPLSEAMAEVKRLTQENALLKLQVNALAGNHRRRLGLRHE